MGRIILQENNTFIIEGVDFVPENSVMSYEKTAQAKDGYHIVFNLEPYCYIPGIARTPVSFHVIQGFDFLAPVESNIVYFEEIWNKFNKCHHWLRQVAYGDFLCLNCKFFFIPNKELGFVKPGLIGGLCENCGQHIYKTITDENGDKKCLAC